MAPAWTGTLLATGLVLISDSWVKSLLSLNQLIDRILKIFDEYPQVFIRCGKPGSKITD